MASVVRKLDTYEGVFLPTTLNVLSILIYLRFGFIVGQAGITGSLLLLVLSYTVNVLTTLSVSAIATNGVVQGGGAYFMISRSLGPEFGGSIGVVFYIGQVLNAGLNVSGFADPLLANFGATNGSFARWLPDSNRWQFVYESILLAICIAICLRGPQMFARSSKLLFKILLVATLAVPLSIFVVKPFSEADEFGKGALYTGPSWKTACENWWPEFTRGAAGGSPNKRENLRDLFGIFFSATAGILAGASMSGDLATPSKSIPRGTLWGLALTFVLYASVILSLGSAVSRHLLRTDVDVIRSINISPAVVVLGEFATSIFSALMGVFGAAKLLQAIARDNIVPFIGIFGRESGGTSAVNPGTSDFPRVSIDDNPRRAIFATYLLTQLTILLDINQIAVYITMAFLMTFVVINLACFLLEVAAAPNFRPSFLYFNARTAFAGFIVCIGAMLAADIVAALTILLLGVLVFIVIHSYAAPKPWGDVSQSIIYHQVRKYLLLLKQDHVKYWRPQILLLVDDPRSGWQLIRFCNYLKKGGLFILGHVVITNDDIHLEAGEIARQRASWEKLRDMHRIKAFFQISASPSIVWGVRNVYLGSGLGGMKPNITVLGLYDEHESGQHRRSQLDVEALPTDDCRKEGHLTKQQWVQIVEDLLTLGSNICVTRGFIDAELPDPEPLFQWPWKRQKQVSKETNTTTDTAVDAAGNNSEPSEITALLHAHGSRKKGNRGHEVQYIDLYPIQMSARLMDEEGQTNGISINFDTYTLILQLGSILHSVKAWQLTHELRVVVFVEKQSEIKRETGRITELLETLRIQARVLVRSLDTDNSVYDTIVKGKPDENNFVSTKLADSRWWAGLKAKRSGSSAISTSASRQQQQQLQQPGSQPLQVAPRHQLGEACDEAVSEFQARPQSYVVPQVIGKKRRTLSSLQQLGVSFTMQSTRWDQRDINGLWESLTDDSDDDDTATADGEQSYTDDLPGTPSSASGARRSMTGVSNKSASTPSGHKRTISGTGSTTEHGDEAGPNFQDVPMDASNLQAPSRERTRSPAPSAGLRFNDLPARAQHLILNALMRSVSQHATVIFTTLPAPALGTNADEAAAKKYHHGLELLTDDLPPVALVHAQSMTVTTEL